MSQHLPVLIGQFTNPLISGQILGHLLAPQLMIDEESFCIEVGRHGGAIRNYLIHRVYFLE
jgi:hypothetical protein